MFKFIVLFLFCSIVNGDLLLQHGKKKGATLYYNRKGEFELERHDDPFRKRGSTAVDRRAKLQKPLSACCDIPELGDNSHLSECSNPKLPGPCNDVQCVFEKSGFLIDKNTLNKEAYRAHLKKWSEANSGWTDAVDRAIADCVDKDLRQYWEYPCKAYDVFTCTGIAMIKKCPESAWKC